MYRWLHNKKHQSPSVWPTPPGAIDQFVWNMKFFHRVILEYVKLRYCFCVWLYHVWFSLNNFMYVCIVFCVWFYHVWLSMCVLACMVFVWFYNVWLYDCQHIENIVITATLNTDRHCYLNIKLLFAALQIVVQFRLFHCFIIIKTKRCIQ